MTRRHRTFTDAEKARAINAARATTDWTDREAVADFAAELLTGGQADNEALEHARRQIMEAMG